ncbi:MAG: hypothetical protein ABW186_18405 [Rhodanobacteraceae bacterium]
MTNGDAIHRRDLTCPKCGAPTIQLPLFVSRRRDPVTCTNCAVKLERVLPAPSYYTLKFIAAILLEAAILPALLLVFGMAWVWLAIVIGALVAINLAVSSFLNARTRVEYVDPADARQDKPGRWYPQ